MRKVIVYLLILLLFACGGDDSSSDGFTLQCDDCNDNTEVEWED